MAKKKPGKGPPKLFIEGMGHFEAVPFLINTKTPSGRPRLCTMLEKDSVVHLAGGEEFMVCYVNRKMLKE